MRRFPLFLAAALCMVLASGCKDEPEYVAPDSSYGLIYDRIFATNCALSGCHHEAEKKRDPDGTLPYLAGEAAYTNLLNATPHDLRAANADLKLVLPGSPDSSFLYQKITFDSSAFQFGSAMPTGGLELTANQIEFVRQWIAAGAPLTGHVADRNLID